MNMRPALTSPNLLVSVLDGSDTPTVLIDIVGNVIYANHALQKRLPAGHNCTPGTAFASISKQQSNNGQRAQYTISAGAQPIAGILQPLFDVDKSQIGQVFFALPPFMQTWSDLDDLLNRELRWETAVDSARQAVWDVTASSGADYKSDSWWKIRGIQDDRAGTDPKKWMFRVHPADIPVVMEHNQNHRVGLTDDVNYQYRFQADDGRWIWIESRGRVVTRLPNGTSDRIIGTDTDITAFKDIEETIQSQAARLKLAIEVAGIGLWHFSLIDKTVHWDDSILDIFGITDGVNVRPHLEWLDMVHPDDLDRMIAYSNDRLEKKADFLQDYRIVRPDGTVRHLRSMAKYHADISGNGPSILGVNIDITEDVEKSIALEDARAAMEHESRHDPLTSLANRRKLDEAHAAILKTAKDNAILPAFAVLHIDLDRFKEINDTLGHAAGDAVLVHAGQLISDIVRHRGLVARVGGDEFVVLVDGHTSVDRLNDIAHQIISASQMPYRFEGHSCAFGMSIGIARHDPYNAIPATAFINADLALYQAKKAGRNCARHFEIGMRKDAITRRLTHRHIAHGIDNKEFTNVYQPQFCAKTRKIIGIEALVRWHSAKNGLIMPDNFLPAAEANGLVGKIDADVLETALRDQISWANHTDDVPRVSVNISSPRLLDPMLGKSLEPLDIPFGRVGFELLETTFLESDTGCLMDNLKMLRSRGIEIEIDDFGSGHASIVGFLKIAPKRLKIDRALVTPIVKSKAQRKIIAAIVEIAKLSGAEVIAEGIETQDHARVAAKIGCDILQGYGLARPLDHDALCTLFENQTVQK